MPPRPPQNQWDASGPGALTKMQAEGLRGAPGRRGAGAGLRVAEDDDGRLVVDGALRTNDAAVYAAGDLVKLSRRAQDPRR